jgi:chemotaxis protein MotB
VLPGGGKDLTRQDGQLRKGENDVVTRKQTLKQAQQELERAERTRLEELKSRLKRPSTPIRPEAVQEPAVARHHSEGLRIQIVDEKNRPMFALARRSCSPIPRKSCTRSAAP